MKKMMMTNDPADKAIKTMMATIFGAWGCGFALFLGFWGVVLYVAYHFITKFW